MMKLADLKRAFNRRRPFPMRPAALLHCRVSYSQFGEDLFLASLFPDPRRVGFFVDVGCYRPVSFSNTYRFYQLGWRGLAIDASRRWEDEWRSVRPRDTFIHQAVAKTTKPMYFCFDRLYPTCSRLVDADSNDALPDTSIDRYEISQLLAQPLGEILKRHGAPRDFDLLNVDCEGLDLSVIETVDFELYRPKVIAIEDHIVRCDSDTTLFLAAKSYRLAAMIGYTKIFATTTE
jgi:hypothetical protein